MLKKFNDKISFSGKIPVENVDYIETDDTLTIFNVPILAEMVQDYSGRKAYKIADEILKVEVNKVPLTIVDNEPTHPAHLSGSNTLQKQDVVVGYMSEPVNKREDMSKTKRYADFVLHNTPRIDALKEAYKSGVIIDTSIGFECEEDFTPGQFLGMDYDFIQRNFILDHNAILIDRFGNRGIGRMPSPIGGIGADSINKKQHNTGGPKMDEKEMAALVKENADMKTKLAEFTNKADEARKVQEADAKKEADKIKVELKDALDEKQKLEDELKVFKDKEEEILNDKKDKLKEKYADFADLIDKADAEYINKKFEDMQKVETKSKNIGSDMFGVKGANADNEQKAFERQYNPKKEDN